MERYVKWPHPTERQIEWMQEQLFRESGPFYHLSTKPLENGLIFQEEEERRIAMNWIGILSKEFRIEILAFALMSNHFHFIIKGERLDGVAFFKQLKKRLSTYFSRKGRIGVLDSVTVGPDTPPISSLKQFRNEIAYVIRNPYVARTDVNPFAWPWCSGYLYFNPFLQQLGSRSVVDLTFREKREITRSSDLALDPSLRVRDRMIVPESYVNYRLVEHLFPNARQFAWWVLKNKWGASNGQVARIAQLDQRTVDEMFPLTAKQKK